MKFVIWCMTMLAAVSSLQAGDRLELRLMPHVTSAPGFIRITVIVERDAENRSLKIEADSKSFYRSSTIQLDGVRAPRTQAINYANLPAGAYLIRAALYGPRTTRAVIQQHAEVRGGGDEDIDALSLHRYRAVPNLGWSAPVFATSCQYRAVPGAS